MLKIDDFMPAVRSAEPSASDAAVRQLAEAGARSALGKTLELLASFKVKVTGDGSRAVYCIPVDLIKRLGEIAKGD